MSFPLFHIDAFTDRPFAGNSVAVYFQAIGDRASARDHRYEPISRFPLQCGKRLQHKYINGKGFGNHQSLFKLLQARGDGREPTRVGS